MVGQVLRMYTQGVVVVVAPNLRPPLVLSPTYLDPPNCYTADPATQVGDLRRQRLLGSVMM